MIAPLSGNGSGRSLLLSRCDADQTFTGSLVPASRWAARLSYCGMTAALWLPTAVLPSVVMGVTPTLHQRRCCCAVGPLLQAPYTGRCAASAAYAGPLGPASPWAVWRSV